MIPTKPRIKRLKPKPRATHEARYDEDEDRRIVLPVNRISKRAKDIIRQGAAHHRCTQSFFFESMIKMHIITHIDINDDYKSRVSSGREQLRVYVHPYYLAWIVSKQKTLETSFSKTLSLLIESYHDKRNLELNPLVCWRHTNSV